jgi:hypothetical protein
MSIGHDAASEPLPEEPEDKEDKEAMDRGSIAHSIFLENSMANVEVIDPKDYPNLTKTDGEYKTPAGWTNKPIKAARARAYADGKVPVLLSKMAQINAMVDETRRYVESLKAKQPLVWAMFQPDGGESELTMVWREGATLCKIRCDRIARNRLVTANFKTTKGSVEPNRWSRSQLLDYYVGAIFYERGIKALCDSPTVESLFLCQQVTAPYLCSAIGINNAWRELADRKVRAGLEEWARCERSGYWPGYPADICYPDLPPWESAQWEEREILSVEQGIAYGSQP